jgi:hypothetical protein
MHAMCPAHSIHPDLITLTIYRENYLQTVKLVMMPFSLSSSYIFSLRSTHCHRFLLKYSQIMFISQSEVWSLILLHVHPLLGNGLINNFPRRQIIGKQSVVRLRNNTGGCDSRDSYNFFFCRNISVCINIKNNFENVSLNNLPFISFCEMMWNLNHKSHYKNELIICSLLKIRYLFQKYYFLFIW